ncbi:MAG TPA: CBS domain-containing protein [Kofleriaceae bacterium]|nr:CBS domain-containing protein [Kofleriaceae bacterium]
MRTELSAGMSMLAFATVADLPVRDVARVSVDTPMWQVVQEMKTKNRGCVLVIEETGALVGIFTERDLLNRVDHSDVLWSHATVGDLMTPMPMVIHGDDSLAEAMRRLTQGRRRHLPIVDDRGRVVGLMSIRDILSYIAGKFPEELMNLPPDPSHEA